MLTPAEAVERAGIEESFGRYYSRDGARPLPVLRIRYDDAEGTWLYIDPRRGSIAARFVTRSRWSRWLYHGLHSLDFPFLVQRRPLWSNTSLRNTLDNGLRRPPLDPPCTEFPPHTTPHVCLETAITQPLAFFLTRRVARLTVRPLSPASARP